MGRLRAGGLAACTMGEGLGHWNEAREGPYICAVMNDRARFAVDWTRPGAKLYL